MRINRKKLLLAMANACMTDKELLERSKIPRATWSKVKNGEREPRPATIGKVAKALGVSVEYLIGEDVR